MRKLQVTEYLVKELKFKSYGCGQLKIVVGFVCCIITIWLTIDEVLLNYSVINPERVTLLVHCTSSYCA
jgi:hypothetical protein